MAPNNSPSTGHTARSVTRGIPIFGEILTAASKVTSTPPYHYITPTSFLLDRAKYLPNRAALCLSAVPQTVTSLCRENWQGQDARTYEDPPHEIELLPLQGVYQCTATTVAGVMNMIEKTLVRQVLVLRKGIGKPSANSAMATPEIGKKAGTLEMASGEAYGAQNDADDDEGGDGGAGNTKQRFRCKHLVPYGPNYDNYDTIWQLLGFYE
ncbi:hypothetical protein B0I35DRAFT_72690 [Stachybotrys elegans]|uniref:Uncharacterized protein n=1 Tax=Stachybotrys elegans TaxID=80388 RepID=A0A8K0WQ01_9HYPO|nr:hypothetical protein B0I35DRAFT_72690 [Stachybotrys elegans]